MIEENVRMYRIKGSKHLLALPYSLRLWDGYDVEIFRKLFRVECSYSSTNPSGGVLTPLDGNLPREWFK